MKECRTCFLHKTEENFHRASRHPDGLQYTCKGCRSRVARDWYRANKIRLKPINRRWKKKNAQKISDQHRVKKYSVRPGQFKALRQRQRGRCAICKRHMESPHIDHNHRTGLVRGLLCKNCNWLLGHAQESKKILLGAIRYLHRTEKQLKRKK